MSSTPLALVPFTHPEIAHAIRSTLSTLGYGARMVAPEDVDDDRAAAHPSAVVFLLGGGQGARERILSTMDRARARPSLALLVSGEHEWEPELIEHCCDCAQWPCSDKELAFRLERLCRAPCPGALAERDPALCETLIELNLIGRSPVFLDAMTRMQRMVGCDAPVLIEGETGTGKELVARAIHYLGARADGPFVPLNCGALPDHLVENELFGHARGAYTDAKSSARGAVGEADGGTLFLDEVEALSPKAQVALLRFMQDKEYRQLGGQRTLRADTRIVAASNADLDDLPTQSRFRPDLYFRLSILTVRLPALRERSDDIAHLARHFIGHYCREYGFGIKRLDPSTLKRLQDYHWPGNIRELENLIHREVLMTPGRQLYLTPGRDERHVYPDRPRTCNGIDLPEFAQAKAQAIEAFERDYLTRLMTEAKGNVTQAARRAGKERRALGKLLKKHAITPEQRRG